MLTDQQKREYINGFGSRCPYCGSHDINAEPVSTDAIEAGILFQPVQCKSCKNCWDDEYNLTTIHEN